MNAVQKDPVFAAIDRHRTALRARWAALRISGSAFVVGRARIRTCDRTAMNSQLYR
jgi:hypothetical protein